MRRRFNDDEPQFLKRTPAGAPRPAGVDTDADTARQTRVTAGRPGTRRCSAGPSRIPDWLVTDWPRSTPSSASSRPARRPTSTWSSARAGRRPALPAGRQALPRRAEHRHVPPRRRLPGGPPGAPSPGRTGRWPSRTAFGREVSPASGRPPSSPRCAGCGGRACRCRTRCRSSAPSCCWSSSATPDGRGGAPAGPAAPGHGGAAPTCGGSWWTRCRCWPGPGWPTATCRRTTCSSTMDGWS